MNRRSKRKHSPSEVKSPPKTEESNRVILAAAILSTLAMIVAVVFYFPWGNADAIGKAEPTRRNSQTDTPRTKQNPDNSSGRSSNDSTLDSRAAVRDVATASLGQSTIELPVRPIEVETEVQQKSLLAAVEQAVKRFPVDPLVAYSAALTYAELLQTERAIELFNSSLALDNSNPDVVVAYADVLLQVGKQQEAVEVLQALADRSEQTGTDLTAPVLTALGEAFSQLGELDQAVVTLQRGTREFPDSGELHLRLSQAQNQLQDFEAAKSNAQKAMKLGSQDRATYLALSTALLRLGERDEALKIREQMPSIDAENPVADDKRYQESFRKFAGHTYAQLGLAYITHDSLTDAEKLLETALSLDPASAKGLAALGDLCHRSGRLGDALRVYERLIAVQPENLVNYHNCASLAISMGDVPLAQKTLVAAAKRDESGYADLYLARFLLSLGNFADAAAYAETAVQRSEDIEAYLVWISALQSQGKTAYAMNALLRAREIAPNDPRLANIQL